MNSWISKLSLNQRLSIPIMSFILLAFLGFQFISYQSYLAIERDNLLSRTQALANGVGMNLTASVLFNDAQSAQEILSALKADSLIVEARLELNNHEQFAQYTNNKFKSVYPTEQQRQLIIQNGHHFAPEMLYLIVPITIDAEEIAHMHIAVSLQALQEMRISHLKYSIIMLLLLCANSIYIINRLQHWIVKPITQLNEGMRRIIKGDKHQPLPQSQYTNDELYELTDGFNNMVDTINLRDLEIRHTMDALGLEKAFADEVVETVQHALIVADPNGIITLANKACERVFNQSPERLIGQPLMDLLKPVERDAMQQLLNSALQKNHQIDHLLLDSAHDTGTRTYQIVSRPLLHRLQTLFAVEDVTEHQKAERQQKMAAKVFDHSQDAILLFGQDGNVSMVNNTFLRLTGYQERDILGQHFLQLIDPKEYAQIQDDIRFSLMMENHWNGEIQVKTTDNEFVPLLARINWISDTHSQDKQTVVIASDLRSMKEIKRLEHLANHDPLTNLANRAKLYQALQNQMVLQTTTRETFAVLFLDLDGFKGVNDTYGHDVGDQVLKIIAEKLRRTVRTRDMVSRLAGDEFVVLLSAMHDVDMVKQTCQRLFERICEPMHIDGFTVTIGASIGCYYVHASDYQDVDDILRRADKAMYEAKLLGKGQIIEYNDGLPHRELAC
ncbi:diguanylate cyclase [Photobacterium japonica]|uniref:diguanylate cyclase domain-containing protein n=1 Tax=Photobacterium japonica TaxID=2910235 RepID=UPI003D0AC893